MEHAAPTKTTKPTKRAILSILAAALMLGVLLASLAAPTRADAQDTGGTDSHTLEAGPVDAPQEESDPLVNVAAPEPDPWAEECPSPTIDQKVLVLAADGKESGLPAIRQALDYLGTPYELHKAAGPEVLGASDLKSGCKAFYSGVILTNGELAYDNNGTWTSAFSPAEWDALYNYEKKFGVRQVSWYTFPEPKYGLNYPSGTVSTTEASPLAARYAGGTQSPFSSYANTSNALAIKGAYAYLAKPMSDPATLSNHNITGVTPLLSDAGGNALAALTSYGDGRQNLALTFDTNQHLTHAQVLSYGLVNWVTKGTFLGERRVYMEPQPDDVFSSTDTWAPETPCGTDLDTPNWSWGQYRMTASDLNALINWQKAKRAQPATAQLAAEMPFNAAYAANDAFKTSVQKNQAQFKWLNHTWDHTSWDDTDGNPLTKTPMGYSDAKGQVTKNNSFAKSMGFHRYKTTSLVTPEISGLHNPAALQGAYDAGVRHTVGDNSRAGRDLPVTAPNEGWYNNAPAAYAPPAGSKPYSILVLPRHATNLFYNVSTPAQWTAEYNCMYRGYWGKDLSYQEVLDKESDMLLSYLLKGSIDPVMFHQANLRAYDGGRSLMGDLLDRTLAKYNALYKLPILSPTEDEVAQKVAERMAYSDAGVTASVVPGKSITITAQKAATVPVTGLQTTGAQLYGGQYTSYVKLAAGQSVTLPLQQ